MLATIIRAAALLACSLQIAQSRSHSARVSRREDGGHVLTPISPSGLSDYEVRGSGHASAGDYITHGLDATMSMADKAYGLRDSESFYWGLDGQPLANITAYAYGKDVRVLSMERFDDVLEAAQCSPSSVVLTFTQEAEFDQVQAAWTWINEATENYVVLVTDSSKCNVEDGDATIRQPWHITHAEFDDETNVVTLSAEAKTWDEAFSDWHLNYDSRGLIKNPITDARRALGIRSSDSYTWGIHKNISGATIPLQATDEKFSATCTSCYFTGEIDIFYDITWSTLSGTLGVIARDVGAHFELDVSIPAKTTFVARPGIDILPIIAPELSSKTIAGVGTLGPKLDLGFDMSLEVTDQLDIAAGFDWELAPNTQYTINFQGFNTEPSIIDSGWHSTTNPTTVSISNDVGFFASIATKIDFRLVAQLGSVHLGAGAQAALVLDAPMFTVNVTEDTGSCDGVYLEFEVGAQADAVAGASAGANFFGIGLGPSYAATATLFNTNTPIGSTCVGTTTGLPDHNIIPAYPTPTPIYNNSTSSIYPYGTGTCSTNGALVCRDETHFGLCNFGKVIWQLVADGTGCFAGRIVGTGVYAVPTPEPTSSTRTGSGSSSSGSCTNGLLYCSDDGTQYALCNWGQRTYQPVAPGTACQAGKIVGTGVYASPPAPTTPPRWRR